MFQKQKQEQNNEERNVKTKYSDDQSSNSDDIPGISPIPFAYNNDILQQKIKIKETTTISSSNKSINSYIPSLRNSQIQITKNIPQQNIENLKLKEMKQTKLNFRPIKNQQELNKSQYILENNVDTIQEIQNKNENIKTQQTLSNLKQKPKSKSQSKTKSNQYQQQQKQPEEQQSEENSLLNDTQQQQRQETEKKSIFINGQTQDIQNIELNVDKQEEQIKLQYKEQNERLLKRKLMKPVITKHPILQQKKILSYGVETISGYKCLDFQYYDEETKKAGNGVKHRYICMEREGDVTCKVEKRYSYNMDMSHSCSVMNFRKMVNGFKKQQQTSDQPISERLIQRICAVIAETRLAFLAAESESIRDLIIEAVKIGQDNKDIAAELLVPRFD